MERMLIRWMLLAVVALGAGCLQVIGYEDVHGGWVTCMDGYKDGNETDVDCGGSCAPCATGKSCDVAGDCESLACKDGTCIAPSCNDGIKDGDESDVDCGGTMCPGCMDGLDCGANADCQSGVCDAGKCVDFLVWAERFGGMSGTDRTSLLGLGVDDTGNAVLGAKFTGEASFGGLLYTGGGDAFARDDPDGHHIWDAEFDAAPLVGLAADSTGDFVAVGVCGAQGVDFGNSASLPAAFSGATFVVWFNGSNVATQIQNYPATLSSDLLGATMLMTSDGHLGRIALAPGANDALIGAYNAQGPYQLGSYAVATGDLLVADISQANSSVSWASTVSDQGGVAGVAFGPSSAVVAGRYSGTADFGSGSLPTATPSGAFVAAFDSLSGKNSWAKGFPGAAPPATLAVDATGNTVLLGQFTGTVDFGAGMLTSTGTSLFVAKLDPTGAALWSKAFAVAEGSPSTSEQITVTTDAAGDILVAVSPGGSVDFGGGLVSGGFLVAKLDPSGTHAWSKGFGVAGDTLAGIAAYDDQQILIGGTFSSTLSFGSKFVTALGNPDIFLAKLSLP